MTSKFGIRTFPPTIWAAWFKFPYQAHIGIWEIPHVTVCRKCVFLGVPSFIGFYVQRSYYELALHLRPGMNKKLFTNRTLALWRIKKYKWRTIWAPTAKTMKNSYYCLLEWRQVVGNKKKFTDVSYQPVASILKVPICGGTSLRNVDSFILQYMTSHPRR